MGLQLVRIVSQSAGVVAVLALIGCFLAATVAIELSRGMHESADEMIRLVRRMAVIGGASVILAGTTSTLYWWRAGVASPAAAAGMAAGMTVAAATFTAVALRLPRDV
jgi:ethanolamine transporter EutH